MNPPQHMQALAYANRIRLKRSAIKRRVLAGDLDPADLIRSLPAELETMAVADLLRAQRRWGRNRTRRVLMSLAINENRTLGRLTERQRNVLALWLDAQHIPSDRRRRQVREELVA